MSSNKRLKSRSGKPVKRKSKMEIFVDTCGDVLEEVWEGVLESLDKSEAPINKEDEKEESFSNFVLFIIDELLQKIEIVSDSESESVESSEEEESMSERSDTSVEASMSDIYTDTEDEEAESTDEYDSMEDSEEYDSDEEEESSE